MPKSESLFSKRIKAGKRRTYFFDIRTTKGNDYFITITESRKKITQNGFERHKIFLYKEDFNKFLKALEEAVNYVKTELLPDFNFDAYSHESEELSENQDSFSTNSGENINTTNDGKIESENNARSRNSIDDVEKW
ncbi:MAG: PUR family DNA/RNA-binding protein [Chitinophagaceae bacterium]|nr:PUR family DNA/RNA-binding protein [Chitinophagaceae bacterium]